MVPNCDNEKGTRGQPKQLVSQPWHKSPHVMLDPVCVVFLHNALFLADPLMLYITTKIQLSCFVLFDICSGQQLELS